MRRALETLAWSLAFALSYAQSPLYTSNQNQYFLHGLARAGFGFLRDDWLVHTSTKTEARTSPQDVASDLRPVPSVRAPRDGKDRRGIQLRTALRTMRSGAGMLREDPLRLCPDRYDP